jgi:hypothetical protein
MFTSSPFHLFTSSPFTSSLLHLFTSSPCQCVDLFTFVTFRFTIVAHSGLALSGACDNGSQVTVVQRISRVIAEKILLDLMRA